ncbi:hypothetical protein [Oryzifoliimicrobium ureilyticus]|uniref:hypothetical protein n=1 Tax=Oryzifoliimicrobium ureilyticus TaxID=3113724 RepID=UPI0030764C6F
MTTAFHIDQANVIAFPQHRVGLRRRSASQQAQVPIIAYDECWYHQDAIFEGEEKGPAPSRPRSTD